LPTAGAVQTLKQFATSRAGFDIRLVNRHANQSGPSSRLLRRMPHPTCVRIAPAAWRWTTTQPPPSDHDWGCHSGVLDRRSEMSKSQLQKRAAAVRTQQSRAVRFCSRPSASARFNRARYTRNRRIGHHWNCGHVDSCSTIR